MITNAILSKVLLGAMTLGSVVALTLPAQAGEVYNRVADQQARINQGVASGQLTWREYARDESRLEAINAQREFDLARDGGRLTWYQQQQLNRELNGDSRQIYFTKHNAATQPGF